MNDLEKYMAEFNQLGVKAQQVGYDFCKDQLTKKVLAAFHFPVNVPMIFFVVEIGIVALAAHWYYNKR